MNNTNLYAILGGGGVGKAVPKDCLVLTPTGYKKISELIIGDYVIGDDGVITKITNIVINNNLKFWKFIFNDNTEAISCEEHNWRIQTPKLRELNKYRVVQTKNMINKINNYRFLGSKKEYYYNIPIVKPIIFTPKKPLILNPYLLGCFLGDGCFLKSGSVELAIGFNEQEQWLNLLPNYKLKKSSEKSTCYYYLFSQFKTEIIKLGLNGKTRNSKFIPEEYLFSSIEDRLLLLQGLMDTDGSVSKKQSNSIAVRFSNSNKNIIDGVIWLVRSLGGLTTLLEDKRAKYRNGVCYSVNIQLTNFNPFKLPRKKELWELYKPKNPCKKIKKAEYVYTGEGYCLQVDNTNNCYIINDFIITHNSYTINNKITENPRYGIRTATTGIAAVNMGSIAGVEDPATINSVLRYYNSEEILRNFFTGKIYLPLKIVADKYQNIIIDEISLMNAGTLDVIVLAIKSFNEKYNKNLGLIVSGDAGQLPPVSGKPFFQAKCWKEFKVDFFTEVKRQKNEEFIKALNLIRVGKVKEAAEWFESNIVFTNEIDDSFRGTTFFSTNVEVDMFNKRCLNKLVGESRIYKAELAGTPPRAWNNIPQQIELKQGCIIQLLYNNLEKNIGFANGDNAIVNELWDKSIYISLLRKNKEIYLRPRTFEHFTFNSKGYKNKKPDATLKAIHARLAYGLTIHKAQGLTLDAVQLNLKGRGTDFLSRQSGMLYTAISRVRTPEGLVIVGTIDDLIKCCYINPSYLPWIK